MRGVSTVIAVVIIVAVTVALSIALAMWLLGVQGMAQRSPARLVITRGTYAVRTLFIDMRNYGPGEATVTAVYVDSRLCSIVWAWDMSTGEYIGEPQPRVRVGREVRVAVRLPFTLRPGALADIRVETAQGHEYHVVLEVRSHRALLYINNGGAHIWDYTPSYMLAVYRDYYSLMYGQLPDVPGLDPGDPSGRGVYRYMFSFNLWYAAMNPLRSNTTMVELALTDGAGTWVFIDLRALENGYIEVYTSFDDVTRVVDARYMVAHRYTIVLTPHPETRSVEIKLLVDGETLYARNATGIYGYIVANICIGIWDPSAIYDLYIDKVEEKIQWANYPATHITEEFNTTSQQVFTGYIDQPGQAPRPLQNPLQLHDGKQGYEILTDI